MPRLTRHSGDPPVTDLEPYESEVASVLDRGFPWLYFPARLERLFESETQHERSRHLVGIGILWIALGVMYALVVRTGPTSTDALSANGLRLAVVVSPGGHRSRCKVHGIVASTS